MDLQSKQAVLDVLNGLKIFEWNGGENPSILVQNNAQNRVKLNNVGVSTETINKYGDANTFCILALAFNEHYADDIVGGKLIVWDSYVDSELRSRVLDGEGTATDAQRLLKALDLIRLFRGEIIN